MAAPTGKGVIYLRDEPELAQRLKVAAAVEGVTMRELVKRELERAGERLEKKQGRSPGKL